MNVEPLHEGSPLTECQQGSPTLTATTSWNPTPADGWANTTIAPALVFEPQGSETARLERMIPTPRPMRREASGGNVAQRQAPDPMEGLWDAGSEDGALGSLLECHTLEEAQEAIEAAQLESLDFHEFRARHIFMAIKTMIHDRKKPSTTLLLPLLKEMVAECPDIYDYASGLPDKGPTFDNFPYHAERVRDLSKRRSTVRLGMDIAELAKNTRVPLESVQGLLTQAEAQAIASALTDPDYEARRFNIDNPPPKPRTVVSLNGISVATAGNLQVLAALPKAGKTAFLGAWMASAMCEGGTLDMLGCSGGNPDGLPLLLFDSEQTPSMFHECILRVLRRAGLERPPEWFHPFCLSGFSHDRAWNFVRSTIRNVAGSKGKLHSVILDGVADITPDVNDPEQSNKLVADLHLIAIERDCPVTCVIHHNPAGKDSRGAPKTRGHLGSQLERKAESNLNLKKTDGVSEVWGEDNQRGAPIPRGKGVCFQWSDTAGMHVSCAPPGEAIRATKLADLEDDARTLFEGKYELRYRELVERAETLLKLKTSAAEAKVAKLRDAKFITMKASKKCYVLSCN